MIRKMMKNQKNSNKDSLWHDLCHKGYYTLFEFL